MVAISVINLTMRALATVGIFLSIRQPEDFLKYAGLLGAQWAGAGLVGLLWAVFGLRIRVYFPSLTEILDAMKEGWTIFLSTAAISFYTTGNAFILGILTNNTIVGYYSAAEKLVKAIAGLLSPLVQALFPRVSKLSKAPGQKNAVTSTTVLMFFLIGTSLTLIIFFGAPLIVNTALGPKYKEAIPVFRILSFVILNLSTAHVWSTLIMIGSGFDRVVLANVIAAALINLSLAIILVPLFEHVGMAIAYLASETWINVFSFVFTIIKGVNPIFRRNMHANWK
jgi:PST family polysaccharide transporter